MKPSQCPSSAHRDQVSGFHLFTNLPTGLLEKLLTTTRLHPSDLTSLYHAAHPSSPSLSFAVDSAAKALLRKHPQGRYLLADPIPGETALSALRYTSRLDFPVTPSHTTSLWSCGRNDWGQGARPSNADTNTLHRCFRVASDSSDYINPPAMVVSIAAGASHSACLTVLGALHVTGANTHGQLGVADLARRSTWTHVLDLKWTRVAQVTCGELHTVALTGDGAVFCTGANAAGQLALGDTKDRTHFQCVRDHGITMIATGRSHTVCLQQNGVVIAAGDNSSGQLGSGRDNGAPNFLHVGCFGRKVVRIACGNDTTMMLTADNMVLVTGKRLSGLSVIGGLGTSRVSHLSVGERFAIVRTMTDDVAFSAHRKRFRVSDEFLRVSAHQVSAGIAHYAIVCDDGTVLAAGGNAFGQVAAGEMGLTLEGSPNARLIRTHHVPLSPVQLPPEYQALQVAAGSFHTIYLLAKTD